MMRTLASIVALLVLLAIGLVVGAVVSNRLPMTEPPGFAKRIKTYFGSNVAQTRHGHPFAELRPRHYAATPAEALRAVGEALGALGYEDVKVDLRKDRVTAVAVTALLRFRDDIRVAVQARGGRVVVNVRSASRVGKGDLGTNTRHVLDLFERLDATLDASRES